MIRLTTYAALILVLIGSGAMAADLAGTYANERLVLVLKGDAPGRYTGTAALGGKTFPLTAVADGQSLIGKFTADGTAFDFSATVDANQLLFRTGKSEYKLVRRVANPLAEPVAVAVPAARVPVDAQFVRLSRVVIYDPMCNNQPAGSMLIPSTWKLQGGVVWRWNAYSPVTLDLHVFNPQGLERLSTYPQMNLVDGIRQSTYQSAIIAGPEAAAAAAANYPEGSFYGGAEVRTLIADPVEFVRTMVVPRYRRDLAQAKIVEGKEIPELSKAAHQKMGGQANQAARVGRVRFSYELQGRAVEEDIYCSLSATGSQGTPVVFWNADVQSFRAAAGRLDATMPLFLVINRSGDMDLKWFAGVMDVANKMQGAAAQQIADAGRLSKYISQRNEEVSQIIRGTYQERQAANDRVFDQYSQSIRGTQRYTDPYENKSVELPGGYTNVFRNGRGEFILSNDANFDPAVTLREEWRRAEPTR